MVDPNANNRFIGPGNTAYVNALLGIYSAVSQVASILPTPTDPALYAPIVQAASAADVATQQTAQVFNIDAKMQTDKTVRALMQAPIQCAAKLPPSPAAAVNGAGAKLCGALNPVLAKFPFNPNSTTMATLPEVNAVFAPETGAIWAIFNGTFKPFFVQQGGQYIPAPNAPQPPNPKFAQFFSHAASLSLKLYPPGSRTVNLQFYSALPAEQGHHHGVDSSRRTEDSQWFVLHMEWSICTRGHGLLRPKPRWGVPGNLGTLPVG